MIEIAPKETEIDATWDDARLYCFALNIDGKTGWRLPTIDELAEIYRSDNDFVKDGYWSSTEVYTFFGVWSQGFNSGNQYTVHKYSNRYVRAIRSVI